MSVFNGQAQHHAENGTFGFTQDTMLTEKEKERDKERGNVQEDTVSVTVQPTDPNNGDERPIRRLARFIRQEATFFRIHLAAFTFIPLIFSGIFYASNGRYHISYLDSMFLCYSAMTVTGLSVVNLSTLTKWQQIILYFLMAIGDITIVSWVMVLIRKRFFRTHCEYIVAKRKRPKLRSRKSMLNSISRPSKPFKARQETPRQLTRRPTLSTPQMSLSTPNVPPLQVHLQSPTRENTDRADADEEPVLDDVGVLTSSPGSGMVDLPHEDDLHATPQPPSQPLSLAPSKIRLDMANTMTYQSTIQSEANDHTLSPRQRRGQTGHGVAMFSPTSILSAHSDFGAVPRESDAARSPPAVGFATGTNANPHMNPRRSMSQVNIRDRRGIPMAKRQPTLISSHPLGPPTYSIVNSPTSMHTNTTYGNDIHPNTHNSKYTGMGGFPGPAHLIHSAMRVMAPHTLEHLGKIERKLTMMPRERTIEGEKVAWLPVNFGELGGDLKELIVGRNSDFRTETLSDDQLEQIGGAEYRALRLLSYLVPAYFVFTQLISVLVFLPWLMSTTTYDSVFEAQPRLVDKSWFAFFQVMGAYTGGGLSLVDMGMLPFQNAYLMIFSLGFVILAGNHALPIFLRCVIWTLSKILPHNAGAQAALTFLLQHPRRCFLYLFPSHQTWFLVICLVLFSAMEWVCFIVLNRGLPAFEAMSTANKVVNGFFQGLAARASGFAIAPLANLAPALQFLYVVMMYIAIYPVALSIRTTNVYEERSLGIFEAPPEDEDEEPDEITKTPSSKERVGKYVQWHLRRQMSVDIWWLVWAVFIIAIIERGKIMNEDLKWFDLFRVLFELVSAFGGIGLTLGLPYDNYSFVGAFSPLSKLVVIVIMVRGRHRGLPVAVDKAVILPNELVTNSGANANAQYQPQPAAPTNNPDTDRGTGMGTAASTPAHPPVPGVTTDEQRHEEPQEPISPTLMYEKDFGVFGEPGPGFGFGSGGGGGGGGHTNVTQGASRDTKQAASTLDTPDMNMQSSWTSTQGTISGVDV